MFLKIGKGKSGGLTLIELIIASAIIGVLAVIAIPKFANMVIKAREAAIRGHLGAFRSAISIYYADNEGWYPEGDLMENLRGKYLDKFPTIDIPTVPSHNPSDSIYSAGTNTNPPVLDLRYLDFRIPPGPGGKTKAWVYIAYGGVFMVNCAHKDSSGNVWENQ